LAVLSLKELKQIGIIEKTKRIKRLESNGNSFNVMLNFNISYIIYLVSFKPISVNIIGSIECSSSERTKASQKEQNNGADDSSSSLTSGQIMSIVIIQLQQ
jgi:hypothetical protein